MTSRIPSPRNGGFSLLELLVAISVAAVLVGIAVPSYRYLIISNRLTAVSNGFVAGLNIARLEAIRRNIQVQFCASSNNGSDTLGGACGSSAGAVYMIKSDGVTPAQLYSAPSIPGDISLSSPVAVRYGGQGLGAKVGDTAPVYSGLLIDLSSSKIKTGNHRCIYITTGSTISSCTYTATSGGCQSNEPTNCQ